MFVRNRHWFTKLQTVPVINFHQAVADKDKDSKDAKPPSKWGAAPRPRHRPQWSFPAHFGPAVVGHGEPCCTMMDRVLPVLGTFSFGSPSKPVRFLCFLSLWLRWRWTWGRAGKGARKFQDSFSRYGLKDQMVAKTVWDSGLSRKRRGLQREQRFLWFAELWVHYLQNLCHLQVRPDDQF